MANKKGLGRGLESLFGLYEEESYKNITSEQSKPMSKEVKDVSEIDIDMI